MKITNVQTVIVNASSYTNWIFVIIKTDGGEKGLGEATLDRFEIPVKQAVEQMALKLIGRDVLEAKTQPADGYGGLVYAAAISGIDQALWDLKGKILEAPVYQLLGGTNLQSIPVYVNINRACRDRTPEGFASFASKAVKAGNNALKCAPFDSFLWSEPIGKHKYLEEGIERAFAVREAIGPDVELHIENHWRFDMTAALEVGKRLSSLRPFWFEAPLPEDNPKAILMVKVKTGLRIAGGEMQIRQEEYIPFLESRAIDVYMPDVKYIGGITGLMKAAALVDAYGLLVAPHNPSGPVATMATLHAAATMDNLLTVEYQYEEADWIHDLVVTEFKVKNGKTPVPIKPGLGVSLNLDLARKHPYQQVLPLRKTQLGG